VPQAGISVGSREGAKTRSDSLLRELRGFV
jgi:hypothetical protein